jgi:hypothetical protein
VVAALRGAFVAMHKDPTVLDEAARVGFDIDPVSGEELDGYAREIQSMSPQAKDLMRMLMRGP